MQTDGLPEDILRLEEAYASNAPGGDKKIHISTFNGRLYRAYESYLDSDNEAAQAVVLKHSLHYLEAVLTIGRPQSHQVKYMDYTILLASKSKRVREVLEDERYANLMVCLCASRAFFTGNKDAPDKFETLKRMLADWLGKRFPENTAVTLESMVDYCYGPAVWALYHDQVHIIQDLPSYLWKLTIPGVLNSRFNNGLEVNQLPFDL